MQMQDAVEDGHLSPRSDATTFDQFFDAQEVLSRQSSGASSSGACCSQVSRDALINVLPACT